MLVNRIVYLIAIATLTFASARPLSADLFQNSLVDDTASVLGGGIGQSTSDDFFGVVSSTSPLQIVGSANNLSSSFAPQVGDVIGRDLVSSGFNFTDGSIRWTIVLPALDPGYVAGTFDMSATFDAELAFQGNPFGSGQPNALNFDLTFDGISQSTFQAQSGFHTTAALNGGFAGGGPVSVVEVVATFPNGLSFNAGSEEFRLFSDSLSIVYSYQFTAVPEPGSFGLLMVGCIGVMARRRR